MHAVNIVQVRTGTVPAVVAAPRPPGTSQHQQGPPPRSLPVHAMAPERSSWEEILVRAGLDRESRELNGGEL